MNTSRETPITGDVATGSSMCKLIPAAFIFDSTSSASSADLNMRSSRGVTSTSPGRSTPIRALPSGRSANGFDPDTLRSMNTRPRVSPCDRLASEREPFLGAQRTSCDGGSCFCSWSAHSRQPHEAADLFFASHLPFAFKRSKRAFDNLSERHPMHNLAAFVALTLSLDDLVEPVVGTLRDSSVQED